MEQRILASVQDSIQELVGRRGQVPAPVPIEKKVSAARGKPRITSILDISRDALMAISRCIDGKKKKEVQVIAHEEEDDGLGKSQTKKDVRRRIKGLRRACGCIDSVVIRDGGRWWGALGRRYTETYSEEEGGTLPACARSLGWKRTR